MSTPLSFYPRPPVDTGMGIHDSHLTGDNPPDIRQHAKNLRKAGFSWDKLLAGGTNKVERARIEVQEGIMPIVRFYAERPHPAFLPNSGEVTAYVAAGAKYFEFGNEPNLVDEVQNGQISPERDAAQWIRGSDIIKSVGGIPVVFACTPGGHMNHRVYTNRFLAEVRRLGRLDSFDRAVLGIHPRPLNNPPDQPRDTGNPPNTTTWNEWTWYREAYFAVLGWRIPMIATEHGYSGRGQENGEHPPMNDTTWAEWNKELFYRFNPSHPKAVAPEFLAACYWLEVNHGVWIHDAPFARDGREWIDSAPRQDDRAWGKAIWTIQPTWNRNGVQPPVEPPTIPPPTPPTVPPREVINKPAWVTIKEAANVPAGAEYWYLKKFQYQDDTQSGGNHVIFVQEPHSTTQRFTVTNGQTVWNDNRLDKPANEPAGNFPMFGGNVYKIWMNGLTSDSVEGMTMPSNHHVNYLTWWEKKVKGGTMPEPTPEWQTALMDNLDAYQLASGLRLNPTAAIQRVMFAQGFVPVVMEKPFTHPQKSYPAVQKGERLSDGAKRYYTWSASEGVRWVERVPTPPETPAQTFTVDTSRQSPNFDTRPVNAPDVVILHHTAGGLAASLNTLCSATSGVSSHYVVGKEGEIYRIVDEGKRAWHAGASVWKGREDCNDYSIGIEIVNTGNGTDPYPAKQQDALVWLLSDIARRRGITRDNVTTHKAVAVPPGRKSDPAGLDVTALLDRVYGAKQQAA